jgi:cytochrome bd-type quinol oxidase subunit 2
MNTADVLKWIFDFVIWVITPTILGVILMLTRSVIAKTDDKPRKSAMRSGFWAGILLFLMVLIYQVAIFLKDGFPEKEIFQGFNIWLALGSGILAFFIFLGGKKMVSPQLSGFATLLIVFVVSYAMLHYLVIRTWNELVLSLTLGITFGIMSHLANPHSFVRHALSEGLDEPSHGHH